MELNELLNYVITFIAGLGSGSLLTILFKKNSKTQSKNKVDNSMMVNGPFVNGNNNNLNENNGKE
ncbi:hypothetical protein ACOQNK_06650 [Acinetobacter baumannii]|uniref:hypothetical protein n=1 Tax=Acinetobacter baumannii TaxID=470 RepID=UPI002956309E|nr:hypothetical protein [Acinetobacter baumannii]